MWSSLFPHSVVVSVGHLLGPWTAIDFLPRPISLTGSVSVSNFPRPRPSTTPNPDPCVTGHTPKQNPYYFYKNPTHTTTDEWRYLENDFWYLTHLCHTLKRVRSRNKLFPPTTVVVIGGPSASGAGVGRVTSTLLPLWSGGVSQVWSRIYVSYRPYP